MSPNRNLFISGMCFLLIGCSPGSSLPGQFELTKPHMDREREAGSAVVKRQPVATDTAPGGLKRPERVEVRHGDDQPEHR
jgi:hypothetical protein